MPKTKAIMMELARASFDIAAIEKSVDLNLTPECFERAITSDCSICGIPPRILVDSSLPRTNGITWSYKAENDNLVNFRAICMECAIKMGQADTQELGFWLPFGLTDKCDIAAVSHWPESKHVALHAPRTKAGKK